MADVTDDPIIFKTPLGDVVEAASITDETAVVGLFGDDRAIVARHAEKLVAMTAICTHAQCTLSFNPNEHTLDCPCHGSRYTLTGKNIQGPAVKPLGPIAITVHGGKIALAE